MHKFILFFASLFSLAGFSFEKISVKDAYASVQNGTALLFDVRESSELQEEGKAAVADFFPKSSIDAKDSIYQAKLAKLPKDKTLIFYCRSGKRAGVVADEFTKLGYTTKNMGAFQDWVAAGYPITK